MTARKGIGNGILPRIHQKQAASFEDAFVVLCDFGDQTFTHYMSQKSAVEQQDVFDVFTFFKKVILKALAEKE